MKKLTLSLAAISALSFAALLPTHAQIIITEVDSAGDNAAYGQDWFELTNEGSNSVNISGWKMDDNSGGSGGAVALTGVSSINAGQSVVFIETTGATATTVVSEFKTAWFGSNVPTGFTIGTYSGSGVGLSSTSGDQVNIYNASNALQAGVTFGPTSNGPTFDNSVAQITNDGTISTKSVAGVNGAFSDTGNGNTDVETGSPGFVPSAAPEPSSGELAAVAAVVLGFFAWRRNTAVRA